MTRDTHVCVGCLGYQDLKKSKSVVVTVCTGLNNAQIIEIVYIANYFSSYEHLHLDMCFVILLSYSFMKTPIANSEWAMGYSTANSSCSRHTQRLFGLRTQPTDYI